MKDIFKPKSNDKIRPLDITVNKHRKSLTALNQKKKGINYQQQYKAKPLSYDLRNISKYGLDLNANVMRA